MFNKRVYSRALSHRGSQKPLQKGELAVALPGLLLWLAAPAEMMWGYLYHLFPAVHFSSETKIRLVPEGQSHGYLPASSPLTSSHLFGATGAQHQPLLGAFSAAPSAGESPAGRGAELTTS